MKISVSHKWLQTFFDTNLPSKEELVNLLQLHAFEIESVKDVSGDVVYELDILANRPDCLSHYGIAREISSITGIKLKKKYLQSPYEGDVSENTILTDSCERFAVLHLTNIDYSKMPENMKEYIEVLGNKSINPIVDLSNYILFMLGQPTHAFDASKVSGNINVREAKKDEKLKLLNGEEIILTEDDMIIVDNDNPVGLAGVMGGEETKVTETTKDIYLEVASFSPQKIRHSSRRFGLMSDASQRFSQGISAELLGYVLNDIISLCETFATVSDVVDMHNAKIPKTKKKTGVSVKEINERLGSSYTEKDIKNVFDKTDFVYEIINSREEFLNVIKGSINTPYKWGAGVRYDSPNEFDCSSLISYAASRAGLSIPRISVNQYLSAKHIEEPKSGDLIFFNSSDESLERRTKHIFEKVFPVSPGTVEGGINHVGVVLDKDTIIHAEGTSGAGKVIEAPFSPELKERSLFAQIWDDEKRFAVEIPVERVDLNTQFDLIEEVARLSGYETIPSTKQKIEKDSKVNELYAKQLHIQKILTSIGFNEIITSSFTNKSEVAVVYPVAKDKGFLRKNLSENMNSSLELNSHIGEILGVSAIKLFEIGNVFTKDVESLKLCIGVCNVSGNPKIKESDIEKEIKNAINIPGGFKNGIWEVSLDEIDINVNSYELPSKITEIRYKEFSRYPFVLRDVAVFVPKDVEVEKLEEIIKSNAGEYFVRLRLFDVFEKDDKISYAYRLVFQSEKETLDDEMILKHTDKIYSALEKEGYEIR